MNTTKTLLTNLLVATILMTSCSKNDDNQSTKITVSNFSTSVDENPDYGTVLGTVSASVNTDDELSFEITSESVENALLIDSLTGELITNSKSAFDYETITEVTGVVTVLAKNTSETLDVSITINDLVDSSLGITDEDFVGTWLYTATNFTVQLEFESNGNYTHTTNNPYPYPKYVESGTYSFDEATNGIRFTKSSSEFHTLYVSSYDLDNVDKFTLDSRNYVKL